MGCLWSGCSRNQCCLMCIEAYSIYINYDILFAVGFTEKCTDWLV
jgi:hypothetical protein